MTEETDDRTIHLSNDEAALVFTASGSLRLYKRTEPHEFDGVLGAALIFLTHESERIRIATELVHAEMEEYTKSIRTAREALAKLLKGAE